MWLPKNHVWEVGQEVMVDPHDPLGTGSGTRIQTVERVLKRFIELDDGTKWNPGGWGTYPRGDSWGSSSLTFPVTEAHRRTLRRDKALAWLENLRKAKAPEEKYKSHKSWETVPLEHLEAAVKALAFAADKENRNV